MKSETYMDQEEVKDLLRFAPHYKIDGGLFFMERKFSEDFLREIWHGWENEICKYCKLSLNFMREFRNDSCWNWDSIMNNIGIYTIKELYQVQKEFHLVQRCIVQPWGAYKTTNFNWVEDV